MKRISQAERIRLLLLDGKPHNTIEILERVYGVGHKGVARIGARIKDLRDSGCEIKGWTDKDNRTIYVYQMTPPILPPRMIPTEVIVDGVKMIRLVAENGDLIAQTQST